MSRTDDPIVCLDRIEKSVRGLASFLYSRGADTPTSSSSKACGVDSSTVIVQSPRHLLNRGLGAFCLGSGEAKVLGPTGSEVLFKRDLSNVCSSETSIQVKIYESMSPNLILPPL